MEHNASKQKERWQRELETRLTAEQTSAMEAVAPKKVYKPKRSRPKRPSRRPQSGSFYRCGQSPSPVWWSVVPSLTDGSSANSMHVVASDTEPNAVALDKALSHRLSREPAEAPRSSTGEAVAARSASIDSDWSSMRSEIATMRTTQLSFHSIANTGLARPYSLTEISQPTSGSSRQAVDCPQGGHFALALWSKKMNELTGLARLLRFDSRLCKHHRAPLAQALESTENYHFQVTGYCMGQMSGFIENGFKLFQPELQESGEIKTVAKQGRESTPTATPSTTLTSGGTFTSSSLATSSLEIDKESPCPVRPSEGNGKAKQARGDSVSLHKASAEAEAKDCSLPSLQRGALSDVRTRGVEQSIQRATSHVARMNRAMSRISRRLNVNYHILPSEMRLRYTQSICSEAEELMELTVAFVHRMERETSRFKSIVETGSDAEGHTTSDASEGGRGGFEDFRLGLGVRAAPRRMCGALAIDQASKPQNLCARIKAKVRNTGSKTVAFLERRSLVSSAWAAKMQERIQGRQKGL